MSSDILIQNSHPKGPPVLINNSIFDRISKKDSTTLCEVVSLLHATGDYVKLHPERARGFDYRCHSICDSLAANIPRLTVVDGYYLGLRRKIVRKVTPKSLPLFRILQCEHSWLITEDLSIIDPYAVGAFTMNPIIIPHRGKYKDYGRDFYLPDKRVGMKVRKRWLYLESLRWTSIMRAALQTIQK